MVVDMSYQVELVWNREFDFVPHGDPKSSLEDAVGYSRDLEAMGNGERVKKTRIVDEAGKVVWQYGGPV